MHQCPICNCDLLENPRYPNYICSDCAALATDINGQALSFSNTSFAGGFRAYYSQSKADYQEHFCYVNGIKCWADEARFGGIVIEKVV